MADEIRPFSHEEIEGPEEQGDDEQDNYDILSNGSEGGEHSLPPYPGHSNVTGKLQLVLFSFFFFPNRIGCADSLLAVFTDIL